MATLDPPSNPPALLQSQFRISKYVERNLIGNL